MNKSTIWYLNGVGSGLDGGVQAGDFVHHAQQVFAGDKHVGACFGRAVGGLQALQRRIEKEPLPVGQLQFVLDFWRVQ